jgi:methylthioribose-1-phosphate isomerase
VKINGRHFRTIWLKETDKRVVQIINQAVLPHCFEILDLQSFDELCKAIKDMYLRGAGLIGAAAASGMYLAALEAGEGSFETDMIRAADVLKHTRPTAGNLAWAVDRMLKGFVPERSLAQKQEDARLAAEAIADEDAEYCKRIGLHGLEIIRALAEKKQGGAVNILTH